MKKFISTALISLGLVASAGAQNYNPLNFLNARSVTVSNTLGLTNILFPTAFQSNIVGLIFTNRANTKVTVAAGTAETLNLCNDVRLFALGNGDWWGPLYNANTNSTTLQSWGPTAYSIHVRMVGGSGANTKTEFVFLPYYGEEFGGDQESTDESFKFSFVPNTTTIVSTSTNVPVWRWPGVKGLRLKSATATDTDGSSQVILLDLSLQSYRP